MGELAFDEFYASFFDRIARTLILAGADRDPARDETQESFARALRRWRKVREMDRPDGWVYVVAMNQLRDERRRTERHPRVASRSDADHASAGTQGAPAEETGAETERDRDRGEHVVHDLEAERLILTRDDHDPRDPDVERPRAQRD